MQIRDTSGRFIAGTDPGPGRNTRYHESMNEQAYRLALLGLTDKQIAVFFAVSETTINNWKQAHPGFLESLTKGKISADAKVAEGLYRRAVGMDIIEERLIRGSDGKWQTVQLRKQLPPNPKAAMVWLATRQPELWGNKQPQSSCDIRTSLEDEIGQMTDEELAEELARLRELIN